MARCPDCNKFVALEAGEPEAQVEVSFDAQGKSYHVTAEVHIVLNCAECGTELKTYDFSAEEDITAKMGALFSGHGDLAVHMSDEDDHGDAEVDETSLEATEEKIKKVVHHGYALAYEVKCSCGETLYEGNFDERVAASEMEDA